MSIYSNDKLNRESYVKKIMLFIDKFCKNDGGITAILNGQFGSGKTTVLKFLEEEIKLKENYEVVYINCWEHNFFNNPLIAILNSLNALKGIPDKIKEKAKKIAKKLPNMFLSTFSNFTNIDLTSLTDNNDVFDEYIEFKNAIEEYRNLLINYCKEINVILLVDELDRCLPEYQIKTLEAIYHLFGITNLITIIAIDKKQLEHSISMHFGNYDNLYGYLAKFIDYEFELPISNTYDFLKQELSIGNNDLMRSTIIECCKSLNFSIRDGMKFVQKINLLTQKPFYIGEPLLYTIMLITKIMEQNIFQEFFKYFIFSEYTTNTKTLLKDTHYMLFLNRIKNTAIYKVLNIIREQNKYYLLYIINFFDDIRTINIKDLAGHLNISEEQANLHVKDNTFRLNRLSSYSSIIDKLKALN